MNERPLGIFVAELSTEYELEVMKCSHSRNYSFDKLISSKRIANKFKFNSNIWHNRVCALLILKLSSLSSLSLSLSVCQSLSLSLCKYIYIYIYISFFIYLSFIYLSLSLSLTFFSACLIMTDRPANRQTWGFIVKLLFVKGKLSGAPQNQRDWNSSAES